MINVTKKTVPSYDITGLSELEYKVLVSILSTPKISEVYQNVEEIEGIDITKTLVRETLEQLYEEVADEWD